MNRNLIPHFIAENIEDKKGNFDAITMFLDISGFTVLTEKLMKKGKAGSEVMAGIINNIFEPVTDAIYQSEGFISKFAGDAFNAIFTKSDAIDVISCALRIKNILKEKGIQRTKFGDFEISIKIGISSGPVEWGIIGDDTQRTFYFRGEAIDGCALSEHQCRKMDIVIDERVYNSVNKDDILIEPLSRGYYRILKAFKDFKEFKIKKKPIKEDILKSFFPDEIIQLKHAGEFREVTPIFISFDESIQNSEFNAMIISILKHCRDYGGYFKEIDYGDKGGVIVIIFGAPVCYENNNKRAIDFITRISLEFKDKIKAGITQGTAFAGFIGSEHRCDYSALSDIVNQSARFMAKANWGEIWISKKINTSIKKYYNTKYLGRRKFKGKSILIPVYKIMGLKTAEDPIYFKGKMIGRKSQLKTLSKYTRKIYNKKFAGTVTVYGEPGIGKSRLVYEFIKKQKNAQVLYLKTDNILKTPYNPLKYFLKNFFGQTDTERKKDFDSTFDKLLLKISDIDNNISKELKRTKSLLSAQMDIYYKDSLYEKLDAMGIYENTLSAYKQLFKGLSLLKPLIIRIEDIHWLDDASIDVFNTLCRGIEDYPIILICTSRINTDGTLPKLRLQTDVPQYSIILNKLANEDVKSFIETNFIKNISSSLLDLIIEKTENNPFYMEQLILFMKENNLLKEEKGRIYPISKDISIPQSVSSIIIARIDRLQTNLKEIIRVSSVLGREGELRILKSIIQFLEESPHDIDTEFDIIENENIWIKLAEIKYIFKHALLHQTAYEMQLESTLIELHGLIAKKLEDIYCQKPNRHYEIATHYYRAKDSKKAISYFEKAKDHYTGTYQNKKALDCIEILLQIADDKRKKLKYSYEKCQIHELLGNIDKGIEIAQKSLNEAIKLKDHENSVWFQNQLSVFFILKDDYSKALSNAKKAEDFAKKAEKPILYSYVYGILGVIYNYLYDPKKAMHYYQLQDKISRQIDHKMFIGNANGNMAIIYMHSGNYERSLECLEISNKMFSAINDKYGIASNYGNMAVIFYNQGDYDKSLAYLEKQKQINEEIGNGMGLAQTIDNLATIHTELGNYKKAVHYLSLEKKIYEENDNKYQLSLIDLHYAKIYTEQGLFKKSERYIKKSRPLIESVGNINSLYSLYTQLGTMYKLKKDYQKAIKYYDKSIKYAEKLGHKHKISLNSYLLADLAFTMKNYDTSHTYLSKSKKIAQESQFKDILDKIILLEHKLLSIQSPEKALHELAKLTEEKSGETLANIHYEIYKINPSAQNSETALQLFNSLYQKTNKYIYKIIIEDLQ